MFNLLLQFTIFLFRCLDFLDLTNMKLDFESAFLQIKKIYNK